MQEQAHSLRTTRQKQKNHGYTPRPDDALQFHQHEVARCVSVAGCLVRRFAFGTLKTRGYASLGRLRIQRGVQQILVSIAPHSYI